MTLAEQLAERITGREYGDLLNSEDISFAKENDLVIVHAHSDDLIMTDGRICDEHYGELFFLDGKLLDYEFPFGNHTIQKTDPRLKVIRGSLKERWTFETNISPIARFDVLEYGEVFIEGFIFSMSALKG